MGCGDGIASRLKRLSVHPTAQSGVHAAPAQPGHELLRHRFDSEYRGEREVKGKGKMATYFLHNAPPGTVTQAEPARESIALNASL